MAKIVNLKRAKKQQDRAKNAAQAAENAAVYGESKIEKILRSTRDAQAKKMLDQHEIEE